MVFVQIVWVIYWSLEGKMISFRSRTFGWAARRIAIVWVFSLKNREKSSITRAPPPDVVRWIKLLERRRRELFSRDLDDVFTKYFYFHTFPRLDTFSPPNHPRCAAFTSFFTTGDATSFFFLGISRCLSREGRCFHMESTKIRQFSCLYTFDNFCVSS